MTFPTGAMLLFFGACPTGWAPPPERPMPPVCVTGGAIGASPCPFSLREHPEMPDGSRWCVKQPEPRP